MDRSGGASPGRNAAQSDDFVTLVRVLLAPAPVAVVLERIVRLAALSVDGCEDAGLCGVDSPGAVPGPRDPDPLLEVLQRDAGQGPCGDALAGADVVHSDDLRSDVRWPALAARAAEHGLASAVAVRLFVADETLGALHLSACEPRAFDDVAVAQAVVFATHAALALSAARTHAANEVRVEQYRAAMLTRELIGQAQGILMERERITAEQAFALIREASQRLNVKVRAVAQELVDTGLLPARLEYDPH